MSHLKDTFKEELFTGEVPAIVTYSIDDLMDRFADCWYVGYRDGMTEAFKNQSHG